MVCCGVLCVVQGECHTRQHFHYMGQSGEVHADQAHRGYNTATDEAGYAALNPLYMR
jgi:D-galacturonate reductase